jgi:cytoskeletal protein CcmA (bactofilin family)
MASDRNNLYNELSEKDTTTEQFNRTDKRFKLDVEYIQESSAEDASNNLVIESSLNNIQIVVGPTKNIELYGNVLVKESINLQSVALEDASINLNASIGGSLTVYGDVSLNKSVNILENLHVAGDTSTNNLLVNVRADISENLHVNGDVSFQRNLDVSGKTILTDLTLINDACFNNNVGIAGNLDVSNVINSEYGIVHADSLSYFGGDPVHFAKLNGSSSILSRLQAVGDSSFSNNVFIARGLDVGSGTTRDLTSFHNDVSFTKNVQIGLDPNNFLRYMGNFSVFYDSSFDENVSITKNLNVGATDISDSLNVDGDVSLNSSVDISNKLNVNGDVSLNSKVDVSDNVNLRSKLVVDGDVSLNANVDIAGAFKINDLVVAGDVSYNANIDVSNRLVVNGDISLNSSVDISNKLNVFELNVYNDVFFNNDASIANKLKVGGDVSLNSGLDVTNNLNVVGDVSINSDTKIGNKLVVDGDVSVNSGLDVTNNLNVIGDVCFNSKLIVENDVSINNNLDVSGNIIIGGNTIISGNTIIMGNLEANDVTFADFSATNIIVNENVIQIGKDISLTNPLKIGIGSYAGQNSQQDDTIAIGRQAGLSSQALNAVAVGTKAGQSSQGSSSIAIGFEAGYQDQANSSGPSIAIGQQAGYDAQSQYAVAIGSQAGYSSQGQRTVAVGTMTGQVGQSIGATAVGHLAGNTNQGANTVALGYGSGNINQGIGGIAIGNEAGKNNQGNYSIGIGYNAGRTTQAENSIILNALGTEINTDSSGLYVAPIRNSVKNNVIQYDTTTKELIYAHQIDISGSITASTYKTSALPTLTNEIGYNNTTTIPASTGIPNQSSSIATLDTVVLQPGVYCVDGFFTVDAQAGNFGTTTYITEGATDLARNYTVVATGGFTTSYISKIIEVSPGTTRTILFRGSQNGSGGYTVVTVDTGEFNVLRIA